MAIAGPIFMAEQREELRVPVLAEVPFLGRLFRSVAIVNVKMRTVLVVSATVIDDKE